MSQIESFVPTTYSDDAEHRRKLAEAINQLITQVNSLSDTLYASVDYVSTGLLTIAENIPDSSIIEVVLRGVSTSAENVGIGLIFGNSEGYLGTTYSGHFTNKVTDEPWSTFNYVTVAPMVFLDDNAVTASFKLYKVSDTLYGIVGTGQSIGESFVSAGSISTAGIITSISLLTTNGLGSLDAGSVSVYLVS